MHKVMVYLSATFLSLSAPLSGIYLAIETQSQYEEYRFTITEKIEAVAATIETSPDEYSPKQVAEFLRLSNEHLVADALIERTIWQNIYFGIGIFVSVWVGVALGTRIRRGNFSPLSN